MHSKTNSFETTPPNKPGVFTPATTSQQGTIPPTVLVERVFVQLQFLDCVCTEWMWHTGMLAWTMWNTSLCCGEYLLMVKTMLHSVPMEIMTSPAAVLTCTLLLFGWMDDQLTGWVVRLARLIGHPPVSLPASRTSCRVQFIKLSTLRDKE